jgi:predicted PurR-regulated permease PerM
MKEERRVSSKKINSLVNLGNKIGKILYILFIILLIYVITLIVREWKVLSFIGKIFSVISPLFIGWFIAWILNPIVKKMTSKGMKRALAVAIAYLSMIFVVVLTLWFVLPSLGEQISDIVTAMPKIANDIKGWIDELFAKLSSMSLENLDTVKSSFLLKIETFFTSIQTNLPETAVNVVSAVVSGTGKIVISLILGFYILFDFDKVSDGFIGLFPKKLKDDVIELMGKLNDTLYSFVSGTLWLSI